MVLQAFYALYFLVLVLEPGFSGSEMAYGHVFSLPYQAGMIRTDEDEYFIEPLERGKQMEEEKGRIHMVYRRSAVAQHPPDALPDVHTGGTVPRGAACRALPGDSSLWKLLEEAIQLFKVWVLFLSE